MSQTRRHLLKGLSGAAAATGVLVAACGLPGTATSGDAGQARFPAPVTVRFLMWASTSQVEQGQIRTLVDKLKLKQPNITVELTMGSAQFDDQLLALFSAGTPPDTWQASS